MIVSKIGILLDIVGATLLALDVLKGQYLQFIRGVFSSYSNLKFNFFILFKKRLSESDEESVEVAKSIGVFFSFVVVFVLILFGVDERIIKYSVGYPIVCLFIHLIGMAIQSKMDALSVVLMRASILLIFPLVYFAMVVFFLISLLLQKPIMLSLYLERWCKKDQAPRVLGFMLLIFGFVLQLIGVSYS